MHRSPKKLLPYLLIPLAGLCLLFGIFRINNLNSVVEKLGERQTLIQDSLKLYEQLHEIDSLLLTGAYQQAIEAYETQMNDSVGKNFTSIADHLRLARLLLNKPTSTSDSGLADHTVTMFVDRQATPEEVKQYDSLTFALTKASWQIENLRKQLTSSTRGDYLTFTSSKGTVVHYVGEVRNSKAHGEGVALLNSGSRYEGTWKNNQRDGYGTFYWIDGEYYEGNYHEDKRHGQGTYYWTNGEKFVGQWDNDQRNGYGIFYGEDGEVIAKGTWKNDELVELDK